MLMRTPLHKITFWVGCWLLVLAQAALSMPASELVSKAQTKRGIPSLLRVQYQRHGNRNEGHFNARNFHNSVSNSHNFRSGNTGNFNVNRTINVNQPGGYHGNYGPNWTGVAAGVAVGAALGIAATTAATAASYPPPPPYPGY